MTDDASDTDVDAQEGGTDPADSDSDGEWTTSTDDQEPLVPTSRDEESTDEIHIATDDSTDRQDDYDQQADTDEYRVPLDLSDADTDDESPTDTDSEAADAYAPEPSSTPVEPGEPSLEHVFFVALGALTMLFVMFHLASLVF